jgi:hypothetical protein
MKFTIEQRVYIVEALAKEKLTDNISVSSIRSTLHVPIPLRWNTLYFIDLNMSVFKSKTTIILSVP